MSVCGASQRHRRQGATEHRVGGAYGVPSTGTLGDREGVTNSDDAGLSDQCP